LPRDVHKRRDAVLALADAREALADGQIARATELAKSANRQSPSLVPAAVMAARMSIAEGKAKQAASVIQKAWGLAPHPDLAAAFAEIVPEETPEARIKRFRPLLKQHQGHREARLLEAELQIAAKEFGEARKALGSLAQDEPDARSLTVMAAIERGEGGEDRLVRAWLAKAVTASRGPQWLCEACGHVHAEWRPTCTHCDGFDTLHWAVPPQSEAALQGPEQMLPLIVGALDGPSPAAVETPETVATPQQTAPSEPMVEPVSGEDTLTLGPEFRIDDEEDASKGADAVQAARGVN
jgi:HemY protein